MFGPLSDIICDPLSGTLADSNVASEKQLWGEPLSGTLVDMNVASEEQL